MPKPSSPKLKYIGGIAVKTPKKLSPVRLCPSVVYCFRTPQCVHTDCCSNSTASWHGRRKEQSCSHSAPSPALTNCQRRSSGKSDVHLQSSRTTTSSGSTTPPKRTRNTLATSPTFTALSGYHRRTCFVSDIVGRQSDCLLLDDPRVKLFITHVGLNSYLEASHAGVPIIGVPLFAGKPCMTR